MFERCKENKQGGQERGRVSEAFKEDGEGQQVGGNLLSNTVLEMTELEFMGKKNLDHDPVLT